MTKMGRLNSSPIDELIKSSEASKGPPVSYVCTKTCRLWFQSIEFVYTDRLNPCCIHEACVLKDRRSRPIICSLSLEKSARENFERAFFIRSTVLLLPHALDERKKEHAVIIDSWEQGHNK